MKVGTVSKVMLGGNADVSTKSGIIIDADVILGKAEGRTKDLKGLVLSNKLMFGKSVSRAKMATVSGVAPLVLADAISANVVELIAFGGAEQSGTPTPDAPVDIVCNNGVLKYVDDELPVGYRRLQDVIYNNDCYYTITGLRPTGADTLKFSFECTQSQPACNVVGCYTTSSAQDNLSLYIGYTQSTAKYLRYNGGTYSSWVIANKRYDAQITPTGSIGMETEETWEQKTFTCSVDFNIGTTSTGATSSKLVGVLYGNIEVVGRAKLIPCERVSDGYIGYYDTYTDTFYEKAWGTEPTTSGYDYSHYVLVAEGTVETINVHSKNLFDKNASYALFNGYLVNASVGQNTTLNAYNGGDKTIIIKVAPNTTYTVTRATNLGPVYDRIRCAAFTTLPVGGSTGVILCNYTNTTQANATFTTLSDTQYVAINVRNSGAVGDDWAQYVDAFQLELGSTATEYAPYYNGGTATAEMLLKVGDYQDQQEIISGAVTRKVGIKVFDGTEEWKSSVTSKFYLDTNYMRNYNSMPLFCTHYKAVLVNSTSGVGYGEIGLFATGTPGTSSARLVIGDDNYTSAGDFKAFLANQYAAGTPVIVVYPLKTETTETVTGQPMTTTQGNNIAEITQASLDGLELSVTYMAGVDATVEEIEGAQLSPDVDVTIE